MWVRKWRELSLPSLHHFRFMIIWTCIEELKISMKLMTSQEYVGFMQAFYSFSIYFLLSSQHSHFTPFPFTPFWLSHLLPFSLSWSYTPLRLLGSLMLPTPFFSLLLKTPKTSFWMGRTPKTSFWMGRTLKTSFCWWKAKNAF